MQELTQEQKQAVVDEVNAPEAPPPADGPVAQMTSIAREEERTGTKVKLPEPNKILALARRELLISRRNASQYVAGLSKKATLRLINAMLTMPDMDEQLPVELKTEEEQAAYVWVQRNLNARFILIQDQISKDIRAKAAAKKAEADAAEAAKASEQPTVDTKSEQTTETKGEVNV